jgi:hypothetical protein
VGECNRPGEGGRGRQPRAGIDPAGKATRPADGGARPVPVPPLWPDGLADSQALSISGLLVELARQQV